MLFGIFSLIIVGVSWTMVGIVMSDAPKRGIDTSFIQIFSAIVSVTLSVLLVSMQPQIACPTLTKYMVLGSFFMSGATNFTLLQFMAKAMKTGPNGIIWTTVQSALVFPFLVGVIYFDVPFNYFRGTGMCLIVLALVMFGLARQSAPVSSNGNGNWRLYTALAFIFTGLQQNFSNTPSYFQEAEVISSIMRTMASGSGVLVAALLFNIIKFNKDRWQLLKLNVARRELWIYIGILQIFGFFVSYMLFYPGMNSLAAAGAGAISYPIVVSSCIVGFRIYSRLILHEKFCYLQVTGIIACMLGVIGICFQN